jgi:hypothetical protein
MTQFAEKIDPKFNRSMFVYTQFNFHLKSFATLADVTSWLGI